MKKIISLILALTLSIGLLISLSACSGKASAGLEFESNGNGTCAVTGIGTCKDTDIVIPQESPDGDKVTEIADEAFKEIAVTSISMPKTVTRVGASAFEN